MIKKSPGCYAILPVNGFFTLHRNGTGTANVLGAMGPNNLYRNVRTDLRQRKEPTFIVFDIVLVQFPGPIPVPFPCSVNKPSRVWHSGQMFCYWYLVRVTLVVD